MQDYLFFLFYEYFAFHENIPAFFALLGVLGRTPVNTVYGPIVMLFTISLLC